MACYEQAYEQGRTEKFSWLTVKINSKMLTIIKSATAGGKKQNANAWVKQKISKYAFMKNKHNKVA